MEYLNIGGQIDPNIIEQRRRMAERYGEMANTKPTGLLSAFANVASSYKQKTEEDAVAELEGQQRAKLAEALSGGNQQLANIYANLPREKLAEAYMQRLQPKEAMTLKSGETLFDPNTNQPVYTNRGVEKPTILSPGQTVLGQDMQPAYTAPEREEAITPYQREQLAIEREKLQAEPKLKIPAGYQPDGQGGVVPIPGSPAAQEVIANKAELNESIIDAQKTLSDIDELVGSVDGKIEPHPGFETSVGRKGASYLFGALEEPFAGTDASDFMSRYTQLKDKSFLSARQMLKGGGAITDFEGRKAENAINRMNNALREEDFIAAARDLQDAIRVGLEKLKTQGGTATVPATSSTPDNDPLGIR